MKRLVVFAVLGVSLLCSAAPVIRIEAENLAGDSKTGSLYHFSGGKNAGKWKELSGSVEIPEAGTWSVWIRCSASWKHYLKYAPLAKAQQLRHFAMDINGKTLKFGTEADANLAWIEQKIELPAGTHKFSLKKIGIDPYVDVIVFTKNPGYKPTPDSHAVGKQKLQDAIVRYEAAEVSAANSTAEIRIEGETLAGDFKAGVQQHYSGGKNATSWQELSGSVEIPEDGTWSVWVRCTTAWKYFLKYYPPELAKSIRHFAMNINGKTLEFSTETEANSAWIEQKIELNKGTHNFSLKKVGINPNVDVVVFTKNPKYKPTPARHVVGKYKYNDTVIRWKAPAAKAVPEIRIECENLEGTNNIYSQFHFSGGKAARKWQTLAGSVELPEGGSWSVWVRCNTTWKYFVKYYGEAKARNMRHFAMEINGKTLNFGTELDVNSAWIEQKIELPAGTHKFSLKKIGVDPYVDVIVFTKDPKYEPKPNWHTVGKQNVADAVIRHVTAAESAKKKTFDIPRIAAPKIDGKLDDSEWKGAITGELVIAGSGAAPAEKTLYRIGGDDKNLYLAFCCNESNIKGIKTTFTHEDNRDSALYSDDCVEIFIDPFNDGISGKYQFIINSKGVFFDGYCGNKNFQSKLQRSCTVTADSWNVEIAIPYEDIGISPKGAETFMLNLTRTRHQAPREYSCLVAGEKGTGFSHLSHFLPFRPVKNNTPVTFFSFGSEVNPYVYFKNSDENDKKQYSVTLSAFDKEGSKIKDFTGVTTPEKQGMINWKITKRKVARLDYTVSTADKKTIYSNSFSFPQLTAPKQTRTIKDPLCESLFSNEYRKQLVCNGYTWSFENLGLGNDHAFVRQYAIDFDLDNYVRILLDTGTFSLFTPRSFEWWDKNFPDKKKDIPVILMPLVNRKLIPAGVSQSLFIIPEVRAAYLKTIREYAARPETKVLTVCDEVAVHHERLLISAMHSSKNVLPAILAIDAKIKKEFGQGKYGIPKADEKNPFALIAFRRFLNREMNDLFREAAAVAREVKPDIKIMSDDPLGSVCWIYDFTEWKDIFDIVTHQLDPQTENMDPMGFLTRYLADLSGVEYVWPCPHVEEYSKSFTPSEVLDELSSAIRNGANGFHFFLNQTIGKRSKQRYLISEYWGAPDRFATMMNVLKFLKTTPKLKEFKRDAAIFVATDTLRSYVKSVLPERDTFLHGFIGNGAGVNYSIINENKLANLEQFKIIFTSQCKYIPEDALKKLQNYVTKGGTLVVLDPEAFSFTPEGKSLEQERINFLGISAVTGNGTAENIKFAGEELSFRGAGYIKTKLTPDAQAAAKFDNGDAAIIRKNHGKGKVLSFTVTPCTANLAGNKSWDKAFENICAAAGCEVNSPIWRFRLPETLAAKLPEVKGVCLTDNSVLWRSFKMDQSNNADIGGTYTISPKPTWVADNGSEKIPFSKGKLTDRPRAAMGASASLGASSWTKWAVAYNPGKEPITIDFNFNQRQAIKKAILWCYGDVRNYEFSVEGQKCSVTGKNKPTMMMEKIELILPQAVVSDKAQIKISGGDKRLVIAEVEIWGE